MTQPKLRRHRSAVQALAWFLPSLAATAVAGMVTHPLTLIPLLLANTLAMAASCHALGFDLEPRFGRTVLRRGAAHLVMFTAYTAAVFALVAWPMLHLSQASSLGAILALVVTMALALAVLWRLWPAFGLVFVWDDAYPAQADSSWIFTAAARSIAFARHLSREERFFTHFLPAGLALLGLAFGAIALAGLYGVLPPEPRIALLALYGAVALPLGCLLIANRTVHGLLSEPAERARVMPEAADSESVVATPKSVATPTFAPVETAPAASGQPPALLVATRDGDIERALALVDAGADPDTAPNADDRDQRPVLMLAALLPDTRLLRALIAKGAQVNRLSGGITPLLAATRDSWHGRAEAVLTLLANGADPLLADGAGNTALHGAALSAEPGVAAMLLDAAAPIDALNTAGDSPLAVACRAANWSLATFLLERGAKPAPAGGVPALLAAASIADDDPAGVMLLLKHRAPVNAIDAQRRSALLIAASEGHEQIARALRSANADVNLADEHGSTALMEAARAGACGVVQLLADAQVDARARDQHGRDALTLACQSPHAHGATIRILLTLGAESKAPGPDGRSALDHAAAAGRWDLVALLDPETPLPASLGTNLLSPGADTPAHLLDALRFGHWAIVSTFAERVREWPQTQLAALYLDLAAPGPASARRWLLDHGLEAEARLSPAATDGDVTSPIGAEETVAPAAADPVPGVLGRRLFDVLLQRLPAATEAVEDLLQAGASPAGSGLLALALAGIGNSPAASALALKLLEQGADPFAPDAHGRTPLHLAAANAQTDLLQALLARGCNPNTHDRDGRTPLFAALEHGPGALPLVRALIAHGANPEAADSNGETPLGLALEHPALERWLDWRDWSRPNRPLRADDLPAAARAGALATVQRLLELGFAVNAQDAQGATALLRACGSGQLEIATCLLEAGADASLAAHSGVTALVAATSARQTALVALLLARDVAVDQRLPNAATALMVAAACGYPEIVEALLAAGATANATDAAGRNALHAAAQFGFEHNDSLRARRLFDVLLKHAADVNHADHEGMTPLLLLLGAHMHPGCACDATHIGALVPVLLDAGAQAGHADQRGVTALHACAMHALLAPARTLLAHGAGRAAADAFGRTAADVARQLGYVDIAHELGVRDNVIPSVRQTLRHPAQPAE